MNCVPDKGQRLAPHGDPLMRAMSAPDEMKFRVSTRMLFLPPGAMVTLDDGSTQTGPCFLEEPWKVERI